MPQSWIRFQGKLLRRSLRRLTQKIRYRRISLQGVPILFANSFPKSGTHLLIQVLQGFSKIGPAVISGLPPIVTFEGDTGRTRQPSEIFDDLGQLLSGDIAYGHLHADNPDIVNFLCREGLATYLILRDPRDVVVSHVYYISDIDTNHIHHHYYTENLQNFNERLRTSILGLPNLEIPFPNIRQRLHPYLGWLDFKEILYLRYEDFVTDRNGTIGQVYDHAIGRNFPTKNTREQAVQILEKQIDPQRSPTFRSGKIGGWRTQFNQENKEIFKDVAGDILIRLGYEQDKGW